MTHPTEPSAPPSGTDPIGEAEKVDEAKTADDAPAPVHPEEEREVLVRDGEGRDPYGADSYGADGERQATTLGDAPDQLPDPRVAALREAKARTDANPVADRTAPPAQAGGRPTDGS